MHADRGSLGIYADLALDDAPRCDVVVVPGGPGQEAAARDQRLLNWLRFMDQTTVWTTSVCTGSLLLGTAGLLRGRRATTHWLSRDRLKEFEAVWGDSRVVVDGKYMTAAGVSAGIDMALLLASEPAGETVAQAIQLSIEYDPQPPFRSGNSTDASPEVVSLVRHVAHGTQPASAPQP